RCAAPLMTTLADHLAQLVASGLIHTAPPAPEAAYLFRHALVQDAAYATLLKQDRRRLHQAIGQVLEQANPAQLAELAPTLADHFREAGDDGRAYRYFTLAGDQAWTRFANYEAARHYATALELAPRVGAGADELAHLYTRRGRALELAGQYDAALATYAAFAAYAAAQGDRRLGLAALMATATIYSIPSPKHDLAYGEPLCHRALALARELDDRPAEARVLWILLLLLSGTSGLRAAEGLAYGEQSLALARELNLREQMALTLNDLNYAYSAVGRNDAALAVVEEATGLWRELGNPTMLADNLTNAAFTYFSFGQYDRALGLAEEAYQLSTRTGNAWGQAYSLGALAAINVERGNLGTAITQLQASIPLAEAGGYVLGRVGSPLRLAYVYDLLGATAEALAWGQRALARADAQLPFWRTPALTVLARIQLRIGNLAEAAALIADAQQSRQPGSNIALPGWAEANLALAQGDYDQVLRFVAALLPELRAGGAQPLLPDALYIQGTALRQLGRLAEARTSLQEAHRVAEAGNARRILWRILDALAQLAAAGGDHASAAQLRRQARAIVDYIAREAGAPELRAAFLARPDVQALEPAAPFAADG
ncbi:MAG TPA: hypothetical protein VKY74_07590, partial [Chloroflexia bacterium]|nr:hypothetical protein [Chloroflexia bacterium]